MGEIEHINLIYPVVKAERDLEKGNVAKESYFVSHLKKGYFYIYRHIFTIELKFINCQEENMSLFINKTLMTTDGTGPFGNAVLNHFLDTYIICAKK